MTQRESLASRGWLIWALLLLLLLGATMAIALNRRSTPPPRDYRPASVEPASPPTLTHLRAA